MQPATKGVFQAGDTQGWIFDVTKSSAAAVNTQRGMAAGFAASHTAAEVMSRSPQIAGVSM
jgi:hypothetical protein